jgi:DNA polymerase I-like protein with 3'-5' exonuclease and polymerase domains
MVAVDIETTGLEWQDRVLSISMAKYGEGGIDLGFINMGYWQESNLFGMTGASTDSRDVAIIPLTPSEARSAFLDFVGDKRWLVFHNGSFDLPFIVRTGVITEQELFDRYDIFDTMVMARATGGHESVSLFSLCQEESIGQDDQLWLAAKGKRAHLDKLPYDHFRHYSEVDAKYTIELASVTLHLVSQIYPDGDLMKEESEWIKLVSMMRYYGLQVDRSAVQEKKSDLIQQANDLRAIISPLGIKSGSDGKGIVRWAERAGIASWLRRTDKGNTSTDEASLEGLKASPAYVDETAKIVNAIVELRSVEKAQSTWIDGVEKRMCSAGRIHSSFSVSGAISNRLKCSNPNVQAFPKEYRKFQAGNGYDLWEIDWSQAEIRLAAMFARSLKFARIFQDPEADPHMETAIEMYGENANKDDRQLAKRANFGSVYCAGPKAISESTGLPEAQSRELLDQHRKAFPKLAKASRKAESTWEKRGYLILLGGKRLYASESDMQRSYKAFNQLIQGSVAELIKKTAIAIRRKHPEVRLLNQVHDSLWLEVPKDRMDIVHSIEEIMRTSIPAYVQELTDPQIPMAVDSERIG